MEMRTVVTTTTKGRHPAFEAARRQALQLVDLVNTLHEADMEKATPCKGWTVRDILAHTTSGGERINGYLSAVLEGRPTEGFNLRDQAAINQQGVEACRNDPALVERFRLVVQQAIDRFDEIQLRGLERQPFVFFASITPMELAALLAADLATHQWDYGQAVGRPRLPDPAILAAALPVMIEELLPKTFLPHKARGLQCSYGIHLTDVPDGEWVVDVNRGHIAVHRQAAAGGRVRTTTDAGRFVLLSYGRLKPLPEMLRGHLKSRGNPLLAMKFGTLFQKV